MRSARRHRGGKGGLRRLRATARRRTEVGGEVWPRQPCRESGTPAVLHQPRERDALPAHEHQQAALLPSAFAARGELRDRPPGARRTGTEVRRDQPLQRRRPD